MTDQDVRDLLERIAAEEPIPFFDATPLTRRARHRAVRTVVVGAVGIAAAIALLFAGVAKIETAPMPADQPTPAPVVSGALAYAVQGDIYVADPDGSNAVKIVDSAADEACTGAGAHWSNEVPSWSPDGKYLAFYHDCSTSEQENVMITDPHGNVVTEFPRDMWGFEWSPDSTRVSVWGTWGREIAVYGIDGERQASLPLPRRMAPHYDSGPGEWMPDGSALLLYGVFVVPLDGSAPHDLSLGGQATYSPDGTRVALVEGKHITILDASGSLVSQVDGRLDGVDGWSPDGQHLVSLSDGVLNVVDAASGTVTVLTQSTAALSGGDKILGVRGFSPQGDRILYETGDGAGGATALWSIGVDGADARLLVAGTTQGEWRSR